MDISGQITAGADSLILSHWQRPDATAGIAWPGRWADKTSRILPDGQWTFEGIDTQQGENLYRVQTPDGLEDIDGYYYVANTEMELHTEETHQRKQALVFRDAVREVLSNDDDYVVIFPEQLILAIGSAENGAFDNGTANSDGIMQVTCNSGEKGAAEGKDCTTYTYTNTEASIKYNVTDGLAALYNAYDVVKSYGKDNRNIAPLENCGDLSKTQPVRPIFQIDNPGEADRLITSIVYYNNWVNYICGYKDNSAGNRWYLHEVARQLSPTNDNSDQTPNGLSNLPNNQNVAQFFADADNLAGMGLTPDLVERLDHGQDHINQLIR